MTASARPARAVAEHAADPPLLRERGVRLTGDGVATDYAEALLARLGARVERAPGPADPDPAHDWARCGAMHLTGRAEGPPRPVAGALAASARGALAALSALSGGGLRDIDAPALLGERAAIAGLTRRGAVAPGGSCRLLRARDGWIALNLARPDDVRDLPAWLACAGESDPWRLAAAGVARRDAQWLAERATWLGLPLAVADAPPVEAPPWLRVAAWGPSAERGEHRRPLVLDLSSLWAGPLATHLLRRLGARVVKVESSRRPDGARNGPPAFFDLLNAGAESVALDLPSPHGIARLRALVRRADVVVESARPRALAQLGIDAETEVRRRPGLTWLCLTGYGRGDPAPGRVAFGDDAGVAAGLTRAVSGDEPVPVFCGDAIADPLAGLHAALAAWASWSVGGGHLLDVALRDVAAHALVHHPAPAPARVEDEGAGFTVVTAAGRAPVLPPRARVPSGTARVLGADTAAVLMELAPGC
jgi:hypothetical protein